MEIKKRKVYQCKTYEDAKSFIDKCKEQGFTWKNGLEIGENPFWDKHKAKTCYKTNLGKITVLSKDDVGDRDVIVYNKCGAIENVYLVSNRLDLRWLLTDLDAQGYSAKSKDGTIYNVPITAIVRDEVLSDSRFADGLFLITTQDKNIYLATKTYVANNKMAYEDYSARVHAIGSIVKRGTYGSTYVVCGVSDSGSSFQCVSKTFDVYLFNIEEVYPTGRRAKHIVAKKGDIYTDGSQYVYIMEDFDGMFASVPLYCGYLDNPTNALYNNPTKKIAFTDDYKKVDCSNSLPIKIGDLFTAKDVLFNVTDVVRDTVIATDINNGCKYALPKCAIKEIISYSEVYTIKDCDLDEAITDTKNKSKLVSKTIGVLQDHGYCGCSEDAVDTIIDEWSYAKAKLADLFRKSDNWDEDNLCIKIRKRETRVVDVRDIRNSLDTIDAFINRRVSWDSKYEILTRAFNAIKYYMGDAFVNSSMKTRIKEIFEFNEIRISCNVGQKLTKLVRDICDKLGYTAIDGFEKCYAKFADCCSSREQDIYYTISINPIDYLLMSNGVSWSSCHYIDAGNGDKCYQSGTLSYMRDTCSFVVSRILADSVEGDCGLATAKKLSRQMFMLSDLAVLQSRLYPDCEDIGLSKIIWDIVKGELDSCEGKVSTYKDIYTNKAQTNIVSKYFKTDSCSTHYCDYEYSYYNICVHEKEDAIRYKFIQPTIIGDSPICPYCGCEHENRDDLRCEDCYVERDDYYDEEEEDW